MRFFFPDLVVRRMHPFLFFRLTSHFCLLFSPPLPVVVIIRRYSCCLLALFNLLCWRLLPHLVAVAALGGGIYVSQEIKKFHCYFRHLFLALAQYPAIS